MDNKNQPQLEEQAEDLEETSGEGADASPEATLDKEALEETQVEESLEAKLEATLAMVDEYKAALQRERADFINYRKRIEREKNELGGAILAQAVASFLPVIDDLDRAIESAPGDMLQNEWGAGVALIHKKLYDLLDNLGVEQIKPLGEPFDPNLHEAIGSEDSDEHASGVVMEVLQKGYMLDGKCIRPAIVKVAN
jgi:molecular chaperone GrpE